MSDFETFYEEKILNGDQNRLGRRASCLEAWTHQEAAIKEMDEVIKLQDVDLRKYEKQIESLKTQLAVYKEDMQKDAEKIAYEQMQASSWKAEYLKMVVERDELHSVTDKALTHVKRQIECFRDLKTEASDMQTKNWWQAKVQILNPIKRILEKALRGASDPFTDARQKAEDQINNGARLTKHQIDL